MQTIAQVQAVDKNMWCTALGWDHNMVCVIEIAN
jgi:hypothetical protein